MPIALAGPPATVRAPAPARRVRVHTAVVPYTLDDDSAVTWAVEKFDPEGGAVLLVIHPDPAGLSAPELADLRGRFARRLAGRYEVTARHPAARPAGLPAEPYPVLRFVRVGRLPVG